MRLSYDLAFITFDLLANIALFVPFGVLVLLALGALGGFQVWLLTFSGFLGSCATEFAQRFIPGRVSNSRGIVTNTLVKFIRLLLMPALQHHLRSPAPQSSLG